MDNSGISTITNPMGGATKLPEWIVEKSDVKPDRLPVLPPPNQPKIDRQPIKTDIGGLNADAAV